MPRRAVKGDCHILKRILVRYDFSDTSAAAVMSASGLADNLQARLDVLHVVPPSGRAEAVTPVESAYQRLLKGHRQLTPDLGSEASLMFTPTEDHADV